MQLLIAQPVVHQVQVDQVAAALILALVRQIGILPLVAQAEHMVILVVKVHFLPQVQHHRPQHKILPEAAEVAQVAEASSVLVQQVQAAGAAQVQSGPTPALLYFTPAAVVVVLSNLQVLLIQVPTDRVQVIMVED